MNPQKCSLWIIGLLETVFVFMAMFNFGGNNTVAAGMWIFVGVMFMVYVLATSVFVINAGEMLAAFFLGTWWKTFINGTYADEARDMDGRKMTGRYHGGVRGLWGSDFVVLLYPFFTAVRLPTTQLEIPFLETEVTTRGSSRDDVSPITLKIDTTFQIALSPNVGSLFNTIPGFNIGDDLTKECDVVDSHYVDDPEHPTVASRHRFHLSGAAAHLLRALEQPTRAALLQIINKKFALYDSGNDFDGDQGGDYLSLLGHQELLQQYLFDMLRREVEGIYRTSGILRAIRPGKRAGRSSSVVNFLMEEPAIPELIAKAKAAVTVAIAEGNAEVIEKTKRGQAERARVEELVDVNDGGITNLDAYRGHVEQTAENLNVFRFK